MCRLTHSRRVCISGADIRTVNVKELTSGVLHTKFWVVDKKHLFIGSANMDWRSLTQVQYTLLKPRCGRNRMMVPTICYMTLLFKVIYYIHVM